MNTEEHLQNVIKKRKQAKALFLYSVSVSLSRKDFLKKVQEESEKQVDKMLPLDLQQHNYQNAIIEHLLDVIYVNSNERSIN